MANKETSITTLGDVARLLAGAHLPEHWHHAAARIASLLGTEHCTLVLAGSGQAVRAYGSARQVPRAAGAMLAAPADDPLPLLHGNALCMPICVDGIVLGVVHVQGSKPLTGQQVDTTQVVALLIGKALQLGRLQIVLHSRFAQLALMQQPASAAIALRHTRDTATLMAKAFYKEMANAGFPPPDIIGAASDIIAELTATLKGEKSSGGTYSGGSGPFQ